MRRSHYFCFVMVIGLLSLFLFMPGIGFGKSPSPVSQKTNKKPTNKAKSVINSKSKKVKEVAESKESPQWEKAPVEPGKLSPVRAVLAAIAVMENLGSLKPPLYIRSTMIADPFDYIGRALKSPPTTKNGCEVTVSQYANGRDGLRNEITRVVFGNYAAKIKKLSKPATQSVSQSDGTQLDEAELGRAICSALANLDLRGGLPQEFELSWKRTEQSEIMVVVTRVPFTPGAHAEVFVTKDSMRVSSSNKAKGITESKESPPEQTPIAEFGELPPGRAVVAAIAAMGNIGSLQPPLYIRSKNSMDGYEVIISQYVNGRDGSRKEIAQFVFGEYEAKIKRLSEPTTQPADPSDGSQSNDAELDRAICSALAYLDMQGGYFKEFELSWRRTKRNEITVFLTYIPFILGAHVTVVVTKDSMRIWPGI
ncbi:MAG: hypothetical protein FWC56_05305 [Phycisphaerae bacterium]|nr:hypothetical protein [Phycisphaerae bacterium]